MENVLEDEILTETECAALLRLHAKTLQRARKRGEPIVPYSKAGRQIRYSKKSVLKAIQAGERYENVVEKPVEIIKSSYPLVGTQRRGRPRKKYTLT